MEGKAGKMPHAVHEAKLVEELFGKGADRILAYYIVGHHTGLPDWSSAKGAGQAALEFQLTQVNDIEDIDLSTVGEANTKPTKSILH